MRLKSVVILAAVAANLSFLYGVAQMKMSVPYCRELVRQDMVEGKRYQDTLINDLVKVGQ